MIDSLRLTLCLPDALLLHMKVALLWLLLLPLPSIRTCFDACEETTLLPALPLLPVLPVLPVLPLLPALRFLPLLPLFPLLLDHSSSSPSPLFLKLVLPELLELLLVLPDLLKLQLQFLELLLVLDPLLTLVLEKLREGLHGRHSGAFGRRCRGHLRRVHVCTQQLHDRLVHTLRPLGLGDGLGNGQGGEGGVPHAEHRVRTPLDELLHRRQMTTVTRRVEGRHAIFGVEHVGCKLRT